MRNSFKTPLTVEVMESGNTFKLVYPFTQRSKRLKVSVCVPRGFVTDFASIPRGARLIIPKLGRHIKASVVHDYLYRHHIIKISDQVSYIFNRKQADDLFLEGMLNLGAILWKARLMYWAVRIGGWLAWRR